MHVRPGRTGGADGRPGHPGHAVRRLARARVHAGRGTRLRTHAGAGRVLSASRAEEAPAPVAIRPLAAGDAAEFAELLAANRSFLAPFEPLRDPSFLTVDGQRDALSRAEAEFETGAAYAFGVIEAGAGPAAIVGLTHLSSIHRGAWQNANLGYWIAEDRGGRGFATEAVGQTVSFAFEVAGLHRVQAAVMPRNDPSLRVLAKNGFRREGLAERYLQIAGVWEDHVILAITIEEWRTS
jgi:ribosomal-protein-alanine N-acetyltransferase